MSVVQLYNLCSYFFFSWLFLALATLFQEYVRSVNSPEAIPVVPSVWKEVTKRESTKALEDAKAVYE